MLYNPDNVSRKGCYCVEKREKYGWLTIVLSPWGETLPYLTWNFLKLIYDGKNYSWSNVDRLNQVKLAYAEESEKNFCINTSTKLEGGMKLEVPGYGAKDTGGGDAGVHYKTVDCFRLGMAYADIIIENNLLD